MEPAQEVKRGGRALNKNRTLLLRILALTFVIAISILIFVYRDKAQEFAIYGYPGIFLISFLANATIILPAPGIAIVFALGTVFPPLGVGIAAGLGATLGEFSGYLAGYGGQAVIEKQSSYESVLNWMAAHRTQSYFALMFLAFIPNPFFDLAGIAAGALRIPVIPFFISVFIGKTLKMLVFALLGSRSYDWLLSAYP